ncbi:MAG: hypothetical protein ABWY29_01975 [Blastococcus sp.]
MPERIAASAEIAAGAAIAGVDSVHEHPEDDDRADTLAAARTILRGRPVGTSG